MKIEIERGGEQEMKVKKRETSNKEVKKITKE